MSVINETALVVEGSNPVGGIPADRTVIWRDHAGHASQRCRKCAPRACTGACTEICPARQQSSGPARPPKPVTVFERLLVGLG